MWALQSASLFDCSLQLNLLQEISINIDCGLSLLQCQEIVATTIINAINEVFHNKIPPYLVLDFIHDQSLMMLSMSPFLCLTGSNEVIQNKLAFAEPWLFRPDNPCNQEIDVLRASGKNPRLFFLYFTLFLCKLQVQRMQYK